MGTRRALVPEADTKVLAQQMINAIHYLHFTVGALHRDIKPENFGFLQRLSPGAPLPKIRLMDFGSAWVLPTPITASTVFDMLDLPPAGTELYMAPECYESKAGPPSDVWGVGVVVHMLLCMDIPFGLTERDPKQYNRVVKETPLTFTSRPWSARSELARFFVGSLLEKDPMERASTTSACSHGWLGHSAEVINSDTSAQAEISRVASRISSVPSFSTMRSNTWFSVATPTPSDLAMYS